MLLQGLHSGEQEGKVKSTVSLAVFISMYHVLVSLDTPTHLNLPQAALQGVALGGVLLLHQVGVITGFCPNTQEMTSHVKQPIYWKAFLRPSLYVKPPHQHYHHNQINSFPSPDR